MHCKSNQISSFTQEVSFSTHVCCFLHEDLLNVVHCFVRYRKEVKCWSEIRPFLDEQNSRTIFSLSLSRRCRVWHTAKCLEGVNNECWNGSWISLRSFLRHYRRYIRRYYSIRSNNEANGLWKQIRAHQNWIMVDVSGISSCLDCRPLNVYGSLNLEEENLSNQSIHDQSRSNILLRIFILNKQWRNFFVQILW